MLQKLLHKVTSYLSSFEKLYFGNLQCADNWHFSKELLRNLHFWYSIIRCWNFKFVNASCHIAMFCEQRVNLKATQICKVYFPKADLQDLQCQVRQWFIVSDLEIAITSSSFASLLKWHETAKVLVLQKLTHFLKWISPELSSLFSHDPSYGWAESISWNGLFVCVCPPSLFHWRPF